MRKILLAAMLMVSGCGKEPADVGNGPAKPPGSATVPDKSEVPDYLAGRLVTPQPTGPARLLADGSWCGHGEPLFRVFDVREGHQATFEIHLPQRVDDELSPPAVRLTPAAGGKAFLVYDPRKHPANLYAHEKYRVLEPKFGGALACERCRSTHFRVAAGFEIPSDSDSPNDTSWFALAARCAACGTEAIVFDDETA